MEQAGCEVMEKQNMGNGKIADSDPTTRGKQIKAGYNKKEECDKRGKRDCKEEVQMTM